GSTTATMFPDANGGPSVATITQLVLAPPNFTKAFGDSQIDLFFGSTLLTFSITNPSANLIPLTDIAFTDMLPAGLTLSMLPSGVIGSCGGGTITAVPGSNTISLMGATLAAGASCSFSVSVTGSSVGLQFNSASITANPGMLIGGPATATISVVPNVFLSF